MLKHAGETSPRDQEVLATYLIQEGGLPSPRDQEVKMGLGEAYYSAYIRVPEKEKEEMMKSGEQ